MTSIQRSLVVVCGMVAMIAAMFGTGGAQTSSIPGNPVIVLPGPNDPGRYDIGSLLETLNEFVQNTTNPARSEAGRVLGNSIQLTRFTKVWKAGASVDAYILYDANVFIRGVYPFNPASAALLEPEKYKVARVKMTGTGDWYQARQETIGSRPTGPRDLMRDWDAYVAERMRDKFIPEPLWGMVKVISKVRSQTGQSSRVKPTIEEDVTWLPDLGHKLFTGNDSDALIGIFKQRLAYRYEALKKVVQDETHNVSIDRARMQEQQEEYAYWRSTYLQSVRLPKDSGRTELNQYGRIESPSTSSLPAPSTSIPTSRPQRDKPSNDKPSRTGRYCDESGIVRGCQVD
jgi:hypothetical protein